MTKSLHTLTVTANDGGGPIVLDVIKSTVTMDEHWSPYIKVSLTIHTPSQANFERLDPRNAIRVAVVLTQTFGTWNIGTRSDTSKSFDLGLRSRKADKLAGTTDIELASDELLLQDYALMNSVPESPGGLSVRNAVNYALAKIGAAPGVRNLHTNPSVEVNSTGYGIANGATITRQTASAIVGTNGLRISAPANGIADSGVNLGVPATLSKGQVCTYSVWVRAVTAGTYRLSVQGSAFTASTVVSLAMTAGQVARISATVIAASDGAVAAYVLRPTALASSVVNWDVDAVMVTLGPTLYDYFDGSTTDVDPYDYAWDGTAGNSTSTRWEHADATLAYDEIILATNLATNPSGEVNTTGWTAVPGTSGTAAVTNPVSTTAFGTHPLRCTWSVASTAAGGGIYFDVPVDAERTYSFGFGHVKPSITNRLQIMIEWRASSTVLATVLGTQTVVTGGAINTAQKLENQTAPPLATQARVYILSVAGTSYANWSAASYLEVDGFMANIGATLNAYFDGDTPATTGIIYRWASTVGGSRSQKVDITQANVVTWAPGVSAWDYLTPIIQATALRLFCDEQRIWHLVAADYTIQGNLILTDSDTVTSARDDISRDENWYDAVVIVYTWVDAAGVSHTAYDVASVAGFSKVLTLEYNTPKPGVGAAAYVLARSRGRGRVFEVEAVSNYSAVPSSAIRVNLANTPIQTGWISSVQWASPENRMTIGSRELLDTPPTAWAFLAAGVKWSDSAVGASWAAETI